MLDAMLPYLTSLYGNPHSRTHAYGWESEEAVETARKVCSSLNTTASIFPIMCVFIASGGPDQC